MLGVDYIRQIDFFPNMERTETVHQRSHPLRVATPPSELQTTELSQIHRDS